MNYDQLIDFIKEVKPSANEKELSGILKKFKVYYDFLIEENAKYNLTGITELEEVILKHFYDSIVVLKYYFLTKQKVCDLGSGAGFPGIPLKIVCPDIDLTFVEPTGKRAKFLEMVCAKLEFKKYHVINDRMESLDDKFRDFFDIVVSRAVSSLPILIELSIPYLKTNGLSIAYKAKLGEEELKDASNCLKLLNAKPFLVKTFNISEDIGRCLVFIKKQSKTNKKYPRNYSLIASKPL